MIREIAVLPACRGPVIPDGAPAFLKLIADTNRLRILAVLARGERCVCDIEGALDLPQNLVSHHLSVLKRAGVVHDRRAGKWIYYRLDPRAVTNQLEALAGLLDVRHADDAAEPCAET